MRDRRTVLRGLAAFPIAAVPTIALPALASFAPEPVVGILQRATALRVLIDHIDADEEDAGDAAFQEMRGLVDDTADSTITTPAGALAALEWARGEFALACADKPGADHLDVVTPRFIDGALKVMRQTVQGGRA